MKKLIALTLLPLSLVLAGCEVGGLRGNGNVVTDQRSIGDFINIETEGAFQVEWNKGPASLTLNAEENLLPYIETKTTGNVLRLRSTRSLRPRRGIKVLLSSSAFEGAELNGASRLTAHQLGGSKFYLESNGATRVIADGAVDEMIATMNGASKLEAEKLQTKSATLVVNGAGKAVVAVSDSLKVSISGAGKVEYIGNPSHIEREIAGAGSIRKRE
jgi:Putative auto-transporter adhesin, head GIN domain